MEELKVVIGVVIYTVVIVVVYLPIWRFIGKYALRYLNQVLQTVFRFNDRKSGILPRVTEHIWCATLLISMTYFNTPFIDNIIFGSEFSYFKHQIFMH